MKSKAKWYLLLGLAILLVSLVIGCEPTVTKEQAISHVQAVAPNFFPGSVDVNSGNPDAWTAARWKDGTWRVSGVIGITFEKELCGGSATWKYTPHPYRIELLSAEFRCVKLLPERGARTIRFNPDTEKFEEMTTDSEPDDETIEEMDLADEAVDG